MHQHVHTCSHWFVQRCEQRIVVFSSVFIPFIPFIPFSLPFIAYVHRGPTLAAMYYTDTQKGMNRCEQQKEHLIIQRVHTCSYLSSYLYTPHTLLLRPPVRTGPPRDDQAHARHSLTFVLRPSECLERLGDFHLNASVGPAFFGE
jgi:hypothetical protein